MLGAGGRNRRLTLQRALVSLDDFGGETRTWGTLGTVWAATRDLSSGERERMSEISSEVTVRFTVLHSEVAAGLTPRDRVICGGLTYDIVAVREVGFRQEIEIDGAARDDLKPSDE